ncbi:MAG: tetratricopeptide repeat protein [Bacteroidia bacterium]|nr:tetratricopeptide repeat protein [Bacteroidia bacterium]
MKRLILTALIAVPLCMLAQPNATIRAFKAEKLFAQGRTNYDNGDYRAAIDIFDQVAELDPDHPMVYELRGESYYKLENFEAAISDYSQAAKQHPESAELRNSLGVASANMGQYRAAASYFYEALQINPNHEYARKNLDIANRKLREYAAAGNTKPGQNPNTGGRNNDDYGLFDRNNPRDNSSGTWEPDPKNKGNAILDRPDADSPVPAKPKERTYAQNKILVGNQSDPFVSIEQVKITETATLITFKVQSVGNTDFPIFLDKKGGANALYISDRAYKKSYRLLNVRSLQGWPEKPFILKPNQEKFFTVEFERIEDNIVFFHILEGQGNREGTWDFWDVELKN